MRERRGHLAAPGVALAHEQHLRQRFANSPSACAHRPQLLAREPLDDHRHEERDRAACRELLLGVLDDAADGLLGEHAVERRS